MLFMLESIVMKPSGPSIFRAALLGLSVLAFTGATADARQCTRLAFSVNDYGKEGPARDAQKLLDQYAERWTAERGIKHYTMGKKTVTCELFLDFGFFDEHTCKAEASVCWGGGTTAAASAMVRSAAGEKAENPLAPAAARSVPNPGAPAIKPR